MLKKILVVCGPTASGKSAVSVEICLRIGGEVVSADSMQIYKGMDILSASPTREEMRGVPHHMIGFLDPGAPFNASAYRDMAKSVVEDIFARGRTPVVCGGTGLYIDSLTRGMRFSEQADNALREELKAEAARPGGQERLHEKLMSIDPESARRFPSTDVRRVIRSIEIYSLTGRTRGEQERIDALTPGDYEPVMFALDWPRDVLYRRIDARVDQMLTNGLIDEVKRLTERERTFPTAFQAIGYKEIASALHGECTLPEAIEKMKTASRNYAKRQLTWLRRDARAVWISAQGKTADQLAEKILAQATPLLHS